MSTDILIKLGVCLAVLLLVSVPIAYLLVSLEREQAKESDEQQDDQRSQRRY